MDRRHPAAIDPNLYLVTISATRNLKGKPVTIAMSQMIFDPAVFGTAAEARGPTAIAENCREPATSTRDSRGAFTLLELLLAMAIAIMLMARCTSP